jgi:yecA family protein
MALQPSYQQADELLQQVNETVTAGEAHGMICGFICMGSCLDGQTWLSRILGESNATAEQLKQAQQILLNLYEQASEKLQTLAFDFDLFLPNEDEPLTKRCLALSHWCQGFVIALQDLGKGEQIVLGEDAQDAFDHLLELVRLDYENTEPSEENERSYQEVKEYVRLAILMIYMDIAEQQQGSTTPSSTKNLH